MTKGLATIAAPLPGSPYDWRHCDPMAAEAAKAVVALAGGSS